MHSVNILISIICLLCIVLVYTKCFCKSSEGLDSGGEYRLQARSYLSCPPYGCSDKVKKIDTTNLTSSNPMKWPYSATYDIGGALPQKEEFVAKQESDHREFVN